MKKYKLRKYNTNFPKLFEEEKRKLKKILPESKIEHIGSTAVFGLKGKGIIDIIIAVPKKEIEKAKNLLVKNNYIFKPKAGDKNRLFFQKDYWKLFGKRRVHLHLTIPNGKDWKECIKVRDKLRKSLNLRKQYEELKKEAIVYAKGEGKKYRKYKNKFLKELSK